MTLEEYIHVAVLLGCDMNAASFKEDKVSVIDDKQGLILCNFADCYKAGYACILNKMIQMAEAGNSKIGRLHRIYAANPNFRDYLNNDKVLNTGKNGLYNFIRFALLPLSVMQVVEMTNRFPTRIA